MCLVVLGEDDLAVGERNVSRQCRAAPGRVQPGGDRTRERCRSEQQRELGDVLHQKSEMPGARSIEQRVQQRCSIERALNVLAPGDDLVLETDTAVVDLADSEE